MTEALEYKTTIGQVISTGKKGAEHNEVDIPLPAGEGWQLLQVLAHPTQQEFNQYFWQRAVPETATASSHTPQSDSFRLNPTIKLTR